jgi:hypothetical protein
MDTLWNRADSALLEELKTKILSGPVLKRPDWNRQFYLKTDWSSQRNVGSFATGRDYT